MLVDESTTKCISLAKSIANRFEIDGIPNNDTKKLHDTNTGIPRADGCSKMHKQGCPLRIIVSNTNGPLTHIENFLFQILETNCSPPAYAIQNSAQLNNEVDQLPSDLYYNMHSLDVMSLFSNIPYELVLDKDKKQWPKTEKNTCLSKATFFFTV